MVIDSFCEEIMVGMVECLRSIGVIRIVMDKNARPPKVGRG